jgi:hypothetical protein
MKRPLPARRQRGQATTELVVLALALVPLFLVLPLIGKYIDLMQTAEAASRYVAFEGIVRNSSGSWKSDPELAAEVRRRFFSRSDAPVKTGDVAGDFAAHRNPLWTGPAGHPLIERFADSVGVQTAVNGLNPLPGAAFAGTWGLSRDNLYTASVTVRPANVSSLPPFDTLGLRIARRTVLLADAWTVRDSAAVRSKIEGSAAVYPIAAFRGLVDIAGQLPPLMFDPAFRVGEFDWDVVPCDRLIGGC